MPRKTALLFLLASLAIFPVVAAPLRIGVFIPGIREGSPTYEDLAKGAERFVSEIPGATLKVFEAGFDQVHLAVIEIRDDADFGIPAQEIVQPSDLHPSGPRRPVGAGS